MPNVRAPRVPASSSASRSRWTSSSPPSATSSAADRSRLELLQGREDLVRGAGALHRAALHVALEVLRAVLACEVDVPGRPLRKALPAGEPDVLTRLPVRVRAVEERVEPRRRERGLPGPLLPDAGEDRLEPAQERLRVLRHLRARRGVRVGRRRREGARDVAARVVDEDPALPALPPADVPRVLDAEVAVHVSVRAPPQSLGVPVAVGKLELELRVAAGAELR